MDITGLSNIYNTPNISTSKIDNSQDDAELMKACEEFESYFLTLMFKETRKTIDYSDGYIKRGHGEQLFTDLLDEEIGKKSATENGGVGLAQVLYEQMKKRH